MKTEAAEYRVSLSLNKPVVTQDIEGVEKLVTAIS
jgi:hypothetical protein